MRAAGFLTLVVALGLMTPPPASAQSLAEVVAKEKARREKLKQEKAEGEGKSYSEQDLDKARRTGPRIGDQSTGSTGSSPPEADSDAEGPEGDGPAEKTEDELRAEEQAAWREQLEAAEADRARVDEEIDAVQRALNDNTQSMFGTARKARLDRLEEAKAMREGVDQRIAALESEGRRKRFRR